MRGRMGATRARDQRARGDGCGTAAPAAAIEAGDVTGDALDLRVVLREARALHEEATQQGSEGLEVVRASASGGDSRHFHDLTINGRTCPCDLRTFGGVGRGAGSRPKRESP